MRQSHSAKETRAGYALNTITVSKDLLAQLDRLCRDLAITREEFLHEAVQSRMSRVHARTARPQTRAEIRAEWEQKKTTVKAALKASAGAWANHDEIGNASRWVRKLRKGSSRRLKRYKR